LLAELQPERDLAIFLLPPIHVDVLLTDPGGTIYLRIPTETRARLDSAPAACYTAAARGRQPESTEE